MRLVILLLDEFLDFLQVLLAEFVVRRDGQQMLALFFRLHVSLAGDAVFDDMPHAVDP